MGHWGNLVCPCAPCLSQSAGRKGEKIMALQAVTLAHLRDGCRYLNSFKRGNLRGQPVSRVGWSERGQLSEGWWADLESVQGVVYVVYSYGTPIAWTPRAMPEGETSRRWIVPPVSYSRSTTNHQDATRAAIEASGGYIGNARVVPATA